MPALNMRLSNIHQGLAERVTAGIILKFANPEQVADWQPFYVGRERTSILSLIIERELNGIPVLLHIGQIDIHTEVAD